jgi:hypothetical protein
MAFAVVPEDKKETRLFLVNSVLVRRASPKWNEFFLTQAVNADGIDGSNYHMTITEDNVEMLEMALCIAHLHFDGVPLYLDFSQLVKVAELLRRHQLGGLLHEYLRNWCRPFIANILDPGYEMWILIAHELGWHKIFQVVARKVSTTIYMSGMYMSKGKYSVGTVELPDETIGKRILGKPHLTTPSAYAKFCTMQTPSFIVTAGSSNCSLTLATKPSICIPRPRPCAGARPINRRACQWLLGRFCEA